MDFGFARLDLNLVTRRIEFPEFASADPAKPLTLIVRCADVRNQDFGASLFKFAQLVKPPAAPDPAPAADTTALAPAAAPPEPDPDEATKRQRLAALYAGSALVGWENVTADGKPVAFSVDAATELLAQMMAHVPDIWATRFRDYVDDVANFRAGPPAVDPVDLGKG